VRNFYNSWLLLFVQKTTGNSKDNVSNKRLKLQLHTITAAQVAQSAKKKSKLKISNAQKPREYRFRIACLIKRIIYFNEIRIKQLF